MWHDLEPVFSGGPITIGRGRVPAPVPTLSALLEQLPSQLGARLPGYGLILTSDDAGPVLPGSSNWTLYHLPGAIAATREKAGKTDSAGISEVAMLPFADEVFDTICVYAVISKLAEHRRLLREVLRILRPDGIVVVVETAENFKFAPFPVGGPAHLLRRYLLEAGLRYVRALSGPTGLYIFAARRGETPG